MIHTTLQAADSVATHEGRATGSARPRPTNGKASKLSGRRGGGYVPRAGETGERAGSLPGRRAAYVGHEREQLRRRSEAHEFTRGDVLDAPDEELFRRIGLWPELHHERP